jgi:hypothetical protein
VRRLALKDLRHRCPPANSKRASRKRSIPLLTMSEVSEFLPGGRVWARAGIEIAGTTQLRLLPRRSLPRSDARAKSGINSLRLIKTSFARSKFRSVMSTIFGVRRRPARVVGASPMRSKHNDLEP